MTNEGEQVRHSVPRRPEYGFGAWQLTLGYICANHSPDVMLKLQVYPASDEYVHWSASVSWGQCFEAVKDCASLGKAFRQLWKVVQSNHAIFLSVEDAVRSPTGYDDQQWIDLHTQDVLHRLIWTTQLAFRTDWEIVIVYQPSETPLNRVQVRLIADQNRVSVGSRGASLIDGLRAMFRNAAPAFAASSGAARENAGGAL